MRNLLYAALGGALIVVLMMISFAAGGSNHYVVPTQPQIVVQAPAPVAVQQPQQIIHEVVRVEQPVQQVEYAPEPVYSAPMEQPVFIQRESNQTRNVILAAGIGVAAGVLIDRAAHRRSSYGYGGGYRQPVYSQYGWGGQNGGRAINRRPTGAFYGQPNRGRRR